MERTCGAETLRSQNMTAGRKTRRHAPRFSSSPPALPNIHSLKPGAARSAVISPNPGRSARTEIPGKSGKSGSFYPLRPPTPNPFQLSVFSVRDPTLRNLNVGFRPGHEKGGAATKAPSKLSEIRREIRSAAPWDSGRRARLPRQAPCACFLQGFAVAGVATGSSRKPVLTRSDG